MRIRPLTQPNVEIMMAMAMSGAPNSGETRLHHGRADAVVLGMIDTT